MVDVPDGADVDVGLRAGEGRHGPRPEARGRRRRLGPRGHVRERGGARDHGGAEGRVGEDAAGAAPEHCGGGHCGGGGARRGVGWV